MARVRQNPDPEFSKFRMKLGVMPDFTGSETANQEIPDGVMDGVNRVFFLDHRPITGSEVVYKDGMMMAREEVDKPGDYIIDYNDQKIVFSEHQIPQKKSVIRVTYRFMRAGD